MVDVEEAELDPLPAEDHEHGVGKVKDLGDVKYVEHPGQARRSLVEPGRQHRGGSAGRRGERGHRHRRISNRLWLLLLFGLGGLAVGGGHGDLARRCNQDGRLQDTVRNCPAIVWGKAGMQAPATSREKKVLKRDWLRGFGSVLFLLFW